MLFQTTEELITHVKQCLELAERKESRLPETLAKFGGGMSGENIRHFLNNLCNVPNGTYLEVGVWNGSTFCPALWQNHGCQGIAIDNWSEFDGNGRPWFLKHLDDFLSDHPAIMFLEQDCFTVDLTGRKVDIFFYDGSHMRADQCRSLTHFWPVLSDRFVFIVDDWNTFEAQYGTADAIKELEIEPVFRWETKTTLDGSYKVDEAASANWWQGLGIFVFKKQ